MTTYIAPLYIFDLDGTLANIEHRLHYITGDQPKDWDAFHRACVNDQPVLPVVRTLQRLLEYGDEVWIFSGRNECVRKQTHIWLATHDIYYDWLQMRPDGDFRADEVLKKEWLDNMLVDDRQRLVAVFEDRDRMVKMWRAAGVTCFQVQDGNY